MVEQRTCSITIAELRKKVEWKNREYMADHWLVRPNIILADVDMRLSREGSYWYLMPTGPDYHEQIKIKQTVCRFGGKREWFECPWCLKRRLTLYRDDGNFKCRICLNLVYYSQKMNYRGIEPPLRRMMRYETATPVPYRTYKGKPTKRTAKHEKLSLKNDEGMAYLIPKFGLDTEQ